MKGRFKIFLPIASLSLLLTVAGLSILIFSPLKNTAWVSKISAAADQPLQSDDKRLAKPVKIYIPKMSRTLYVSDGYLISNKWIVSQTGVSYYTDSALPGYGNTVIYGHNAQGILGGLWRVQDGDTIYVVMDSGDFVKYQVFEKKEIQPTQVEILNQTTDSRLTVYTCSGFLDQTRFVVVAKQLIV